MVNREVRPCNFSQYPLSIPYLHRVLYFRNDFAFSGSSSGGDRNRTVLHDEEEVEERGGHFSTFR